MDPGHGVRKEGVLATGQSHVVGDLTGRLGRGHGRQGVAQCNAVVESFWARMQTELLDTRRWRTRVELCTATLGWVEGLYNRVRRHSILGMMSPVNYEKLHSGMTTVA
jgi:putative transposase